MLELPSPVIGFSSRTFGVQVGVRHISRQNIRAWQESRIPPAVLNRFDQCIMAGVPVLWARREKADYTHQMIVTDSLCPLPVRKPSSSSRSVNRKPGMEHAKFTRSHFNPPILSAFLERNETRTP